MIKNVKREFSAGGIIFNAQNQVLICQPSGSDYWQFPKGHIEKGESAQQAAIREVKEEVGVEAEIIAKAGESKYVYTSPEGDKIFKLVTIFAMNYLSGDISKHDWEMQEVIWASPEQALDQLSFSNDKQLLQKALSIKIVGTR